MSQKYASETEEIHALVEQAKIGDETAWEELVKLFGPHAIRASFKIVHSTEAAEDCVQDAFTRAFEKLHTFRHESQFKSWFTRIVINESLIYLRKHKKDKKTISFGECASFLSGAKTPQTKDRDSFLGKVFRNEAVYDKTGRGFDILIEPASPDKDFLKLETNEIIGKTLPSLPRKYKEVLIMRYFNEMNYQEIAELKNCPVRTVKAQVWRATRMMLKRISELYGVSCDILSFERVKNEDLSGVVKILRPRVLATPRV